MVLFNAVREGERGIALDLSSFRAAREQMETTAFLIDLGGDEALLLPAWDAQILPTGEGGAELEARAASVALGLRRERSWAKRRLAMPDFLLGYSDALQSASEDTDVYAALRMAAVPVVGAYRAIVFMSVVPGEEESFHPMGDSALPFSLPPLPATAVRRVTEPQVLTKSSSPTAELDGLSPLTAILEAARVAQILSAPVGSEALLVLLERRVERVFSGEDRALLGALLRQAESALARIFSERRLAPPETGIP